MCFLRRRNALRRDLFLYHISTTSYFDLHAPMSDGWNKLLLLLLESNQDIIYDEFCPQFVIGTRSNIRSIHASCSRSASFRF